MDAAQWPKQVGGLTRPMEEISTTPNNINPTNNSRATPETLERKARPQKDQNLNCPRCNSTNTKFCYYNNYSLTQPRYFCKTCRRYWTQGGSLRSVPVGGGSRKNKRLSTSSSSSSSIITSTTTPTKLIPDLNPPNSFSHLLTTASQNPNKFLDQGQDLNLAFPIQGGIFHDLPKIEGNHSNNENHEPIMNNLSGNLNISTTNTCTTTTTTTIGSNNSAPLSALELLRTGLASRVSLNSYVPMPMPMPMPDSNTLYPSGFPNLQEFKPSMSVFSSQGDHHHHDHHHDQHHDNNMIGSLEANVGGGARLLFPFADMNKLTSSRTTTDQHHEIDDQSKGGNDHHHHHHHHHHQGPTHEYWNGMLGGGTW